MYSNSAIPQLTRAAIYHGLFSRFLRWAYQANVMKTLEQTRRPAVLKRTDLKIMGMGRTLGVRVEGAAIFRFAFGVFSPHLV
jgi:hypothetical protein